MSKARRPRSKARRRSAGLDLAAASITARASALAPPVRKALAYARAAPASAGSALWAAASGARLAGSLVFFCAAGGCDGARAFGLKGAMGSVQAPNASISATTDRLRSPTDAVRTSGDLSNIRNPLDERAQAPVRR